MGGSCDVVVAEQDGSSCSYDCPQARWMAIYFQLRIGTAGLTQVYMSKSKITEPGERGRDARASGYSKIGKLFKPCS